MTHVPILLLALLIGIVADLRAFTAPAVVSWAAFLDWLHVDGTWASWMGNSITVGLLTVLLVVELITDQLPKTSSRKTPQFIARLISGGFSAAVIGAAWAFTFPAIAAGLVGAVLGTVGGCEARRRLVAATGGRDLPIALLEDGVAVGGGFLIAYPTSTV